MAKIIQTTVDAEGNVHVDLGGFTGDECMHEDRRLNEDLEQLGLVQAADGMLRKTVAPPTANRGVYKVGS